MGGGADGITFCLQTESNSATSTGGGLGYGGISPSVAVEFDTYNNGTTGGYNDINANHIGIDTNGSVASLEQIAAPWNMKNGATYWAWVDYDGATNALDVYFNNSETRPSTPILSDTIDLTSLIGQQVYFGFTGSTGGGYEEQDIGSVYFNNTYTPLDPATQSYQTAATAVSAQAGATCLQPGAETTVTATATDPSGNPVSGQAITFSASDGSMSPQTAVTDSNGQATATFTAGSSDATATITAVAQGGAYGTTDLLVDGTPPTTSQEGLETAPGTDWTSQAPTVTLEATDAGSGVAATYYTIDSGPQQTYDGPFQLSEPDGSYVISYWSVDEAGNQEQPSQAYADIDTTPPTTTAPALAPSDDSDWTRGPVTVSLDATDTGSGVAATYYTLGGTQYTYDGPFQVSGAGSREISYWSVDEAGNQEQPEVGYVNIAAPSAIVTTATGLVSEQLCDWTDAPRTVTLSASGGFGTLTTYYTLDGVTQQTYDGPFQVSGAGCHTVTYWSTDTIGDSESANVGYASIDTTAPVTTAQVPGGWHRRSVVVLLHASDAGSGVKATYYRIDHGALEQGTTVLVRALANHRMDGRHTVTFYSADNAGNVETAHTVTVLIDTTPPRLRMSRSS